MKYTLTQRIFRKIQQEGLRSLCSSVQRKVYLKFLSSVCSRLPFLVAFLHPKINNLLIECTNACNLRCQMCYSRNRAKGFMDDALFKKILSELPKLKPRQVTLNFGGESLLHPRFKEMVTALMGVENRRFLVGWYTNGMLFTEDLAKLVVELGVDWIKFSLDGFKEFNDAIRVGANYDLIEKNLMVFLKVRGGKKKPLVGINMTAQGRDPKVKTAFCKHWLDRGVDFVNVTFCLSSDITVKETPEREYVDKLKRGKYCLSAFVDFGVFWNGDVATCCRDWQGNKVMGNITQDSISKVWVNGKFKRLRKALLRKDFHEFPLCAKCNYWQFYYDHEYFMRDGLAVVLEGNFETYTKAAA